MQSMHQLIGSVRRLSMVVAGRTHHGRDNGWIIMDRRLDRCWRHRRRDNRHRSDLLLLLLLYWFRSGLSINFQVFDITVSKLHHRYNSTNYLTSGEVAWPILCPKTFDIAEKDRWGVGVDSYQEMTSQSRERNKKDCVTDRWSFRRIDIETWW